MLFFVFFLCRTTPPHTVLRSTVTISLYVSRRTTASTRQEAGGGGGTVRSCIVRKRRADKVLPRPRRRLLLYNSLSWSEHVPLTCAYDIIYGTHNGHVELEKYPKLATRYVVILLGETAIKPFSFLWEGSTDRYAQTSYRYFFIPIQLMTLENTFFFVILLLLGCYRGGSATETGAALPAAGDMLCHPTPVRGGAKSCFFC